MSMYSRERSIVLEESVGLMAKNLQVVSFDSKWKEVYLGTARRDRFIAVCPNEVDEASQIDFTWYNGNDSDVGEGPTTTQITTSKWCPLDFCTVLVVGSQYGIQFFDWDGSVMICNFNFAENGIGIDDTKVTGGMARGVAAIGANFIAVGIHTGTILLFEVTSAQPSFICQLVDSQRCHIVATTDLASTSTSANETLVSSDESGHINIWSLQDKSLKHVRNIEPFGEFPVTCINLWNKIGQGVIVAAYGSGHIRIFSIADGAIVAEANAHAGWINGMDLATHSGRVITVAEDGFVKVWQLSQRGHVFAFRYARSIPNSFLVGTKFLDPFGSAFAVSAFDSNKIKIFDA